MNRLDLIEGTLYAYWMMRTIDLVAGNLRGRPRDVIRYIDFQFARLELVDVVADLFGPRYAA